MGENTLAYNHGNNKYYFAIAMVCSSLWSCTTPSEKFSLVAADLNFQPQIITTPLFRHTLFVNQDAVSRHKLTTIHIYLDGDGTPWNNKRWLSKDPTSRNPLILQLMGLDKSPALLLGRPCYHGLNKTLKCNPKHWTSHRYSPVIVQSMRLALLQWLAQREYDQVVLIGYSGGGVLAMLLADQIPKLSYVITIAANLNVSEWSLYHGYPPLQDSLNPAKLELNTQVQQLHFAGTEDKVVPAFIIEQFAGQQKNATYQLISGQDHRCCWLQVWPEILELL